MKKEKDTSIFNILDSFKVDLVNDESNVFLDFLYDENTDKKPTKHQKPSTNFASSNFNKPAYYSSEETSNRKGKRHIMYLLNKRDNPPTRDEIDYILGKRPKKSNFLDRKTSDAPPTDNKFANKNSSYSR